MSAIVVQDILERIKQLPEADRLLLEKQLAELEEQEWRQATAEARPSALARGIDQAAIDRAIDQLRRPT